MSIGEIWTMNGISFSRYVLIRFVQISSCFISVLCFYSAIDDILDKGVGEFTLEDLLQEEELLQEIKAKNARLLEV